MNDSILLWLQSAESVGFRFQVRGGKLVVSPASCIDELGSDYIRANRDALIELVEGREAMRATFNAELGIRGRETK